MNPYIQYMYSYPHKTAYRPLHNVNLSDYMENLAGEGHSLYLHLPFCESRCGYCNLFSVAGCGGAQRDAYLDALEQEIDFAASACSGNRLNTVYIGGGTPSCLYGGALKEIFTALRDCFDINGNAEITVECNPESATEAFAQECRECGVNRISMGLQSSCDDVLRAVGRIHSFDEYVFAVKLLKRYFDNVSSDIILGLPRQTSDDVSRSVDVISEYCDHISVYALSVEQGTPLCNSGYLPDDDRVADLYDYACARYA